jgi:hypothetical protein
VTTERKIKANRANSQKSTGPTTSKGKKYSSQNAVKHGYFSRKPSLSETEQEELDTLVSQLEKNYLPKTPLQHLAVRDIAWCTRRCGIALILEGRSVDALMEQTEKTETVVSETPIKPAAFYADSPFDLRTGISHLKSILQDFRENQIVREEWEPALQILFGSRFFPSLTDWKYADVSSVHLANMMRAKVKDYHLQLPEGLREYEERPPIVGDPFQKQHLTEKLLEYQLRHMQEFLATWEQRAEANSAANPRIVDFCPRHYTTATRDLHRAIEWYWRLKELERAV